MMEEESAWSHLPLCNFNEYVQEICEAIAQRHRQSEENDQVKSTTYQFEQRYVHRAVNWTGDAKMEQIIRLCSNIPGYTPTYFQREFNREILECMSPLIFGNAPANELALHLRKYNMTPPETQFLFAGTARRAGKSDTLTYTSAAILASVPNINILYFSLFKPTCQLACATTEKWLRDWGFSTQIKCKSLQIAFYGENSRDVRTITFITGQNANVIICSLNDFCQFSEDVRCVFRVCECRLAMFDHGPPPIFIIFRLINENYFCGGCTLSCMN